MIYRQTQQEIFWPSTIYDDVVVSNEEQWLRSVTTHSFFNLRYGNSARPIIECFNCQHTAREEDRDKLYGQQ